MSSSSAQGVIIMELQPQQAGSTLVLSPAGRIDHMHADAFKLALDPHLSDCTKDGAALVLDFSGVSYISSIGLRALMVAIKQVKAQGGRMVLASLQPLVLEVFTISRFDMLFEIFPDRVAALAVVGGAS
ncbi:STAS domain-containing protein [Rugamonas sp. A1-17]|nr:STAS domain-containing protein [Rugamonas sp. A1-17]